MSRGEPADKIGTEDPGTDQRIRSGTVFQTNRYLMPLSDSGLSGLSAVGSGFPALTAEIGRM